MSFPGKVRRRACGQPTSVSKNVRMRGSPCPKAWVCPVPERVGPEVEADPHKSQPSSCVEKGWKRGRNARTTAYLCRGTLSEGNKQCSNCPVCCRYLKKGRRQFCVGDCRYAQGICLWSPGD